MSSKYRSATTYTQSELDREAEVMEQIHQARIAGDSSSESEDGQDEDELDDDEVRCTCSGKWNQFLWGMKPVIMVFLELDSITLNPALWKSFQKANFPRLIETVFNFNA